MVYRWFQLGKEERQRTWRMYGWFSGLMMCGSCVGVVAWTAWMLVISNEYRAKRDGDISLVDEALLSSISHRWNAVFRVTYAVEFMCLSVVKLMVLHRLLEFAMSRLWAVGWRIVITFVVVVNLVGLAGGIANATRFSIIADIYMEASADFAVNSTDDSSSVSAGFEKYNQAQKEFQDALSISSVQPFCEVAVLLFIVVAFFVVGVMCFRRVRSAFSALSAADPIMEAGRLLQRRIVYTTCVVFVTFLIRSVYSTLYAVAYRLQDIFNDCPGDDSNLCNVSCFNDFSRIAMWMHYTPWFQATIVLISRPLPLLVSLWGMSTGHMRRTKSQGEIAGTKRGALQKVAFWRRNHFPLLPTRPQIQASS
jgi:hypothetical protein